MEFADIAFAMLFGLAGAGHCIGMCGAVVGALTFSQRKTTLGSRRKSAVLPAYHLGRVSSYGVAGAIFGYAGETFAALLPVSPVSFGHLVAGVFFIAAGIQLAGWVQALRPLEQGGALVWRHLVKPVTTRLPALSTPAAALVTGAVWGWLPCGLVYAMLPLAMAQGSAAGGAGIMLAFGCATVPSLLGAGYVLDRLRRLVNHSLARNLAGAAIFAFGVWSLASAVQAHH